MPMPTTKNVPVAASLFIILIITISIYSIHHPVGDNIGHGDTRINYATSCRTSNKKG